MNEASEGAVKRIQNYMAHLPYCSGLSGGPPRTTLECTCGLVEAKRELRGRLLSPEEDRPSIYLDSNLTRRCECGHRLDKHGYDGCFVSDCGCETDWMSDLPGGIRMARQAGAKMMGNDA